MGYNPNYGPPGGGFGQQNIPSTSSAPQRPTESYEYQQAKKKKKRSDIMIALAIVLWIVGIALVAVGMSSYSYYNNYEMNYGQFAAGMVINSIAFFLCLCGACTRG